MQESLLVPQRDSKRLDSHMRCFHLHLVLHRSVCGSNAASVLVRSRAWNRVSRVAIEIQRAGPYGVHRREDLRINNRSDQLSRPLSSFRDHRCFYLVRKWIFWCAIRCSSPHRRNLPFPDCALLWLQVFSRFKRALKPVLLRFDYTVAQQLQWLHHQDEARGAEKRRKGEDLELLWRRGWLLPVYSGK